MLKKSLVCLLILASSLSAPLLLLSHSVEAATAAESGCERNTILGLPTWYEYLDIGPKNGDKCAITGPLNDKADPNSGINWGEAGGKIGLAVVDILLRVAGVIAIGFTIYGGIQYVLSEGDPEKAKKARESIFNALIGLVIVIVSTGVVKFVGNTLIK